MVTTVVSANPENMQEHKQRPHTSLCFPPRFRLGSGTGRPSGTAPRPMSCMPNTPTKLRLDAHRSANTVAVCTQMMKPRCIQLGINILACLACLAFSESDMTIADESDIGQSQSYTTARLRSYDNQSPGNHARGCISPGPEGRPRGNTSPSGPNPTTWKTTLLLRVRCRAVCIKA